MNKQNNSQNKLENVNPTSGKLYPIYLALSMIALFCGFLLIKYAEGSYLLSISGVIIVMLSLAANIVFIRKIRG